MDSKGSNLHPVYSHISFENQCICMDECSEMEFNACASQTSFAVPELSDNINYRNHKS